MEETGFKNNILVVDDKLENLQLLVEMLKIEGYNPRVASNGELAIKASRNKKPDLILLDINMPDMNGYEVCKVLKNDPELKDIPIIFLSALNETFDKVKAFELGGIDYITKPFQTEEVNARIKTQLKLKRYQDEIEQKNKELEATLKKLEETQTQLVFAEKMSSMGVLASRLTHEINNPINSIRNCSNMLIYSFDDLKNIIKELDHIGESNETVKKVITEFKSKNEYDNIARIFDEMTATISSASNKAEEIIGGIRDFAGKDSNEESEIDIHDIIDFVLVLAKDQFKSEIEIKKIFGDIPKFHCNSRYISQIISSILNNAYESIFSKDTNDGDYILIKTSLINEKYISLEISDTGKGIKQENYSKLFDPFFTTKNDPEHPGLGLSICYGILKSIGGEISFKSEENIGTAFYINLPIKF